MEQYLTEIKGTMDQLDGIGVNIPKELRILLLLNSLPTEYQLFKNTQNALNELPTFLELESRLLDEELQVTMDADKKEEAEALCMTKKG